MTAAVGWLVVWPAIWAREMKLSASKETAAIQSPHSGRLNLAVDINTI